MRKFLCLLLLSVMSGCTSIVVRQPDTALHITRVEIRNNPKVIVQGFVDVMRDGFARHGIATDIIPADAKVSPEVFVVTYTALRSWDFVPYLSHAEIRIERDGRQVAYAEYHLKGKGGYSMMKWEGVKTKMDPVMDQLLAGISVDEHVPAPASETETVAARELGPTPETATTGERLVELKKFLDAGAITAEEYEVKKKALVEKL